MGIIGLGNVGRQVANVARLLGAEVSYYDLHRAPVSLEEALQLTFRPFDELLSSCDVVSLHTPLTPSTRGMMSGREFSRMRPDALLINASSGEVVDHHALAEALEEGRLGGVALDTIHPEPPAPDHPLLNLSPEARDRLLVTPHIAGSTRGALARMLRVSLSNLARVARGDGPSHVINAVKGIRTRPSSPQCGAFPGLTRRV